jgi:undecaprenyl-phosphate 4-deoxy-4-formamido-L-arabinose transferase
MVRKGLVSIVIPVYRSENFLASTVREFLEYFEPRRECEIILVNDGSPDGVEQVIARLCADDQRLRGVTLGANVGQHRATLRGFQMARGDVVLTVDDDGQNPPEAALAVLQGLEEAGLDVAYGRFGIVEQSAGRRFASGFNRWLSRRTMNNARDIAITNVRAIRGDLARAIGRMESPYPYVDAFIFRMTGRIGEVPVTHRKRSAGTSNYSMAKLLSLWISHMTSLTVLPLRFAMVGSFGVSIVGFVIGAVELALALARGGAPAGWLSLFVAVTFLFSVLFAFLGIISAYLGRMYVAQNERGLLWVRAEHPGGTASEGPQPNTAAVARTRGPYEQG